MENQMEEKNQNEVETGVIQAFIEETTRIMHFRDSTKSF